MKTILRRALTAGSVCVLAAGLSFAQGPYPRGGHDPVSMMATHLNLTTDQQAQVKTIFDQARTEAEPLRTQAESLKSSIDAAVKANDTAKITQLATTRGALMGQMEAIHLQAQAKIYQLLTPTQQQQFGTGGMGHGFGAGMHHGSNQ